MKIIPPRPVSLGLFLFGGFAVIGLGLGCDKRDLSVAHPATTSDLFRLTADWPAFAQNRSTKVDILFMVDDSMSMAPLQTKLVAEFSAFTSVLEGLPGGTPDLHLGVVSSSMGAGRNAGIDHCPRDGDRGVLQNARAGPSCAGVELADRFIAVHTDPSTGQLVTNYGAAPLADAFGCIAVLGEGGCGFEHQLSSVRHALDPALAPAENAGFMRPDALLAVILVSNEDDCSAPGDSDFFDDTSSDASSDASSNASSNASSKVSDPLGPLQSFRCNEFGHLCLIDGKLQPPPRGVALDDLQGCRSAEDGRLDKVSDFVSFLKGLKSDPALVFLAAFAGPPHPYGVGVGQSPNASAPNTWPFVRHSCTSADGAFADPAVRIAQAVESFGAHGTFSEICNQTYRGVLGEIANDFIRPIAPACVARPAEGGPACAVVDRWTDDGGRRMAARLPSCADAPSAQPCWRLLDHDARCATTQQYLAVDRGGLPGPATLVTAIDCTVPHP